MRSLVVQPPGPPLGVGVVRWRAPDPCLTVVVKASFSHAEGPRLTAASAHPVPCAAKASEIPGFEAELAYPSDFVPFKPVVDVLCAGHAFAERSPATRIDARLALGTAARSFSLIAREPALRIPLGARHVHDGDGETRAAPVGPVPLERAPEAGFAHEEGFDYSGYCSAPLPQRSAPLGPGAALDLTGLSPKGRLRLELPDVAPRVLVRWAGVGDEEIEVNLDTVWIDTDHEVVTLVWRGAADAPGDLTVDQIVVALEPVGERRAWPAVTRNVARGTFSFAVEPDAPEPGPRPGTGEAERLQAARYEAHGFEEGAEPSVSLEQYAAISAELAEQRAPRADVLARHGHDEDTWLVEERGWLEAMANHALRGDARPAARYGELFVAAQDRLGAPAEAERTVADYADLTAALEQADDLARALADRELTVASWMRLERRFQRAFAADPTLRAELDRRLAASRGARARADG